MLDYPSRNRLSSVGVSPYAYDNNGNLTSKTEASGTTTYTWDFENRLIAVNLPSGGTVNFSYDPFGRRILKTGTDYLYDGANMLAELDSSGNVAASYVMSLGIDEPLLMNRAGSLSYYHPDGLGSSTSLTYTNGSIAAAYSYDSFGTHSSSNDSLGNPFLYTAREFDGETGLYYYRARYYESLIGRFVSQDPLGLALQQNNSYWYVQNNPTRFTDPLGLVAIGLIGVSGTGLAAMPAGGPAGDVGCMFVFDFKGNVGVLCCLGLGMAFGWAAEISPQYTAIVCPLCETICDMPGLFAEVGGFVSKGGGVGVSGGIVLSGSGLSLMLSAGPAGGAGGAATVIIGNCELVLGGKKCSKCPSKK